MRDELQTLGVGKDLEVGVLVLLPVDVVQLLLPYLLWKLLVQLVIKEIELAVEVIDLSLEHRGLISDCGQVGQLLVEPLKVDTGLERTAIVVDREDNPDLAKWSRLVISGCLEIRQVVLWFRHRPRN